MAQKYSFVGIYKREGKRLISNTTCLLIAQRKPTLSKPEYFILDKTCPPGQYISSLYPKGENIYIFEYKGVRYELLLNSDKAIINLT